MLYCNAGERKKDEGDVHHSEQQEKAHANLG